MPNTVPRPTPTTAPSSEITTDSRVIIRLTCGLVSATARNNPISRVRSTMLKPKVLTMPSTAMMMLRASRA